MRAAADARRLRLVRRRRRPVARVPGELRHAAARGRGHDGHHAADKGREADGAPRVRPRVRGRRARRRRRLRRRRLRAVPRRVVPAPRARGAGRLGAGARVPAGQGPGAALPPGPAGAALARARRRHVRLARRAAFIGPAARLARRRRGARAQAGVYYEAGRLRPAGLPRARALRPSVRRGARRRLRRLSQCQIKAHIRQRRLLRAAHADRGRLPRIGAETVPGLRPGRVGRVPAVGSRRHGGLRVRDDQRALAQVLLHVARRAELGALRRRGPAREHGPLRVRQLRRRGVLAGLARVL
mmetsp:Transcript_13018/g.34559  ORF Transcript_13018/g.34559 Transcript_13018/m.34559 type:complete len:299 (-) Transcript_13018:491-1387(-)